MTDLPWVALFSAVLRSRTATLIESIIIDVSKVFRSQILLNSCKYAPSSTKAECHNKYWCTFYHLLHRFGRNRWPSWCHEYIRSPTRYVTGNHCPHILSFGVICAQNLNSQCGQCFKEVIARNPGGTMPAEVLRGLPIGVVTELLSQRKARHTFFRSTSRMGYRYWLVTVTIAKEVQHLKSMAANKPK